MVIGIIFGAALGVLSMGIICRARSAGTLIVVNSDEPNEAPYLFFEVANPNKLFDNEYVRVRVKRQKAISQK